MKIIFLPNKLCRLSLVVVYFCSNLHDEIEKVARTVAVGMETTGKHSYALFRFFPNRGAEMASTSASRDSSDRIN